MPYSNISELPDYIKKLPENKQRQFMHIINSCLADGKPESRCFAMANGVVHRNKEAGAGDEWDDTNGLIERDDFVLDMVEHFYGTDGAGVGEEEMELEDADGVVVIDTDSLLVETNKLARADMQASSFAYVDSSGGKHLPIHDASHVRNALARFNQTHFENDAKKRAAYRKILAAAKRYGIDVSKKDASIAQRVSGLMAALTGQRRVKGDLTPDLHENVLCVVKQGDGRLRWYARYSNAWEDRDRELVTEAAHKEYVDWLYSQKESVFPELWLWHTPGTRFGRADWIDFSSGFAHASGLIDDTDAARSVVDYLSKQSELLGVSHGMLCSQQGKYITKYRTLEISVLPLDRASVWTTDFVLSNKENIMAFTEERRKFLVDAFGEDTVKSLEASTEATAQHLKELGVEYKATSGEGEKDDAAAVTTLASQIADLSQNVAQLVGVVSDVKKDVDTLKKPQDERDEEAFLAKVAKAFGQNGGGGRPTESKENIVAEREKAASAGRDDFFAQQMAKAFGFVTETNNNGGVGSVGAGTVSVGAGKE